MRETALYEVGLRFSVDTGVPPPRKALDGARETVRAVIVEASSGEEAEAQVDQIRLALEDDANRWDSLGNVTILRLIIPTRRGVGAA